MARNARPITRLRGIYYLAIGLAAVALAVGYGLAGQPWIGLAPGLLAAGWLGGEHRGYSWLSSAGLVTWVLMAAVGLLFAMNAGWAIVATGAALVGWDIGRFNRSMAHINRIDQAEMIERRYRRRLLAVVALGAILAAAANFIRVDFGFGIALLLGLISIAGFSRAISFLRHESD